MKRNAIIRIVLWCIVLIVLLGILTTFLLGNTAYRLLRSSVSTSPLETHIAVAVTTSESTAPSLPDTPTASSAPGTATAPTVAEPSATAEATQPASMPPYGIGSSFSVPMNDVSEIEVEWVAGTITVEQSDGTEIQIQEDGEYKSQYTMYVRQKGKELTITYLPWGTNLLGVGSDVPTQKDLTILIPRDWAGEKLEIASASSTLDIRNLTVQEFEFEGGSGKAVFTDCVVDSLDLATMSGDVDFTGSLNKLDWEAASANLTAVLSNVPRELDLEGAQLAAITHGDSLGYMPAAAVTHIISRILTDENTDLKEIVLDARDMMEQLFAGDRHLEELIRIMNLAVELSENAADDLENIHALGEGWVTEETLGISLYCALRYKDDFSAGIIASVNHKGDSDSTGAVTGNILGALLGYSAMEEKWKENLELKDVILEMADDLCHGCQMREYSYYYDPAWECKYIKMHRFVPET